MRSIIAELGLAVVTAVVTAVLVLFLTSESFMANSLGNVVEHQIAPSDKGGYISNEVCDNLLRRKSPQIAVKQTTIVASVGSYVNLLDNVYASNADGVDITSRIICRKDGELIPSLLYAEAEGTHRIELYVTDKTETEDYGKSTSVYLNVTIVSAL